MDNSWSFSELRKTCSYLCCDRLIMLGCRRTLKVPKHVRQRYRVIQSFFLPWKHLENQCNLIDESLGNKWKILGSKSGKEWRNFHDDIYIREKVRKRVSWKIVYLCISKWKMFLIWKHLQRGFWVKYVLKKNYGPSRKKVKNILKKRYGPSGKEV